MPTTSGTGPTVARRRSTTWSSCSVGTTGSPRGRVPRQAGCGRRRGVLPAGRPTAAGSADTGLDGSAVGAGEGADRTGGRRDRSRHPHARLARRASRPGLGYYPPIVASAPAGGDDLWAAGGRPDLTVDTLSGGVAVSVATGDARRRRMFARPCSTTSLLSCTPPRLRYPKMYHLTFRSHAREGIERERWWRRWRSPG